jgi:hypothetical protein
MQVLTEPAEPMFPQNIAKAQNVAVSLPKAPFSGKYFRVEFCVRKELNNDTDNESS